MGDQHHPQVPVSTVWHARPVQYGWYLAGKSTEDPPCSRPSRIRTTFVRNISAGRGGGEIILSHWTACLGARGMRQDTGEAPILLPCCGAAGMMRELLRGGILRTVLSRLPRPAQTQI